MLALEKELNKMKKIEEGWDFSYVTGKWHYFIKTKEKGYFGYFVSLCHELMINISEDFKLENDNIDNCEKCMEILNLIKKKENKI